MTCYCGHQLHHHADAGRCEMGDDDGGGYFDPCGCEGYDERPPMPPGVAVTMGPGVYHEVTLPDGTVLGVSPPITLSSVGVIFIPF